MRAHLAAHGVEVPPEVKKGRIGNLNFSVKDPDGNLNFSVKDPDGHTVEFVQYQPDGWTLKDAGRHMGGPRIAARIRHVGFTVRSLDKALAFYRDLLGFTESWRGSSDGRRLSWVNLRLPGSDEYIELMLYSGELPLERMGALNHLSLEVPDVPKAAAELEARPARALYERAIAHKTGINRRRQLNLFDPDGTRTELMEPDTVDGVPPAWSDAPLPD
jgi:lactoylglutathione lyase